MLKPLSMMFCRKEYEMKYTRAALLIAAFLAVLTGCCATPRIVEGGKVRITITPNADAPLTVHGRSTTLRDIAQVFESLGVTPDNPVEITAGESVAWEHVAAVMGKLAELGQKRVSVSGTFTEDN